MRISLENLSLHLLRRIAIRHRLIGSFVLLSLLPLIISGYISYVESSNAIKERMRIFSTEVVKQVSKNVRLQMARLESESEPLVLSDRVQTAFAKCDSGNEMDQAAARADLTRVLLEYYGSFDFINQKYFLDKDNKIVDAQVFPELGSGIVHAVERAPNLRGRPYWGTYDDSVGQRSMVMLRRIYSKASNKLVGTLFLGIQPSHFSTIFEDVNLGSGTDIFVLDGTDGKVIVKRSEPATAGEGSVFEPALLQEIKHSMPRVQPVGFVSYSGKSSDHYLAAYSRIPGTTWLVVSTIPFDKLTTEALSVRDKIIWIGLLCFLTSIALAAIIARSISSPLAKLVHTMRETKSGNYRNRMQPEGNDELTVLTQEFNEMANKIDRHNAQLEDRVNERTRDLAEANSKLKALSLTDGLTGIANRRHFDETLLSELNRAVRTQTPLALMMVDVDFFKDYNDFYGHQEGDACLRRVANLLQVHSRRASDLVARYGGEEFVLIAADTDVATALALAESIRTSLEAMQLPHERSPLGCVTISVGVVVVVPDEAQTPEMLGRMADKAMYRAKGQGRNQVVLAGRNVAA